MRCHSKLNNHKKAMAAAQKLIQTEKISNEWLNEAHMTVGKAAMSMDSTSTALKAFQHLSKNLSNELAVEAKYLIAKIEFDRDNLKKSESLLFEIINEAPSYDFWIGKSFILIAEVYYQRGNVVQAKATLQSIIDNYEHDPDSKRPNLVNVAKNKKQEIIRKEKQKEKVSDKEDMELNYGSGEESGLFDEKQDNQQQNDQTGEENSQDSPATNNNNNPDKQ
jgi:tetratricopeptide (TPR) repeat protein